MKSTELRIGNIVCHSANHQCVIESININFVTVDGDERRLDYGGLSPIPLTEEWLLKFGFYQLPHFTVGNNWLIDYGLSSQISISCIESCNMMVWLASVDKDKKPTDLVCVWNWDVNGTMHIHQLQNLYFVLTGEELTIK
jgi:hypothetical protein